jgi:predicted nucleotidyltransferase
LTVRRISVKQFREELTRIVANLRGYEPQQVILFGSFARGDYHALSDVDLLIVKETDTPFVERIGQVLALCEGKGVLPVEPLVYTPAELAQMQQGRNPLIEQALSEGIVIDECESSRSRSLADPGSA